MNRNQDVDHKAEALRLLEWLGDPTDPRTGATGDPRVRDALAVAQIHSNLAIATELHATRTILANSLANIEDRLAEGQERVAEELRLLREKVVTVETDDLSDDEILARAGAIQDGDHA